MSSPSPPAKRRRWPFIAVSVVCLLVAGVAVVRSRRMPELTETDLRAARARWESLDAQSYDIRVEVRGMQPGVYEVSVKEGLAVSASFDGRPLTRPRTFGTWSVMGMFSTLAADLETDARHDTLMLGVQFDPTTGIPMRYERIEMRTGMHDALQWTVTKFETL